MKADDAEQFTSLGAGRRPIPWYSISKVPNRTSQFVASQSLLDLLISLLEE